MAGASVLSTWQQLYGPLQPQNWLYPRNGVLASLWQAQLVRISSLCISTWQRRFLLVAKLFSVLPIACAEADVRGTSKP